MANRVVGSQGVYPTTSVIQGNPLLIWGVGLWEALFVVSQKWSFPTALVANRTVWTFSWPLKQ